MSLSPRLRDEDVPASFLLFGLRKWSWGAEKRPEPAAWKGCPTPAAYLPAANLRPSPTNKAPVARLRTAPVEEVSRSRELIPAANQATSEQ